MSKHNVVKISKNVYWVGVKDWNSRLFDALISLPYGTSYNSYLIVGKNKNVLVDTVKPGFEKELEEKVEQILDPKDLDYVVMNHAEPDHAGAIPYIMALSNKAKLITSKKGAKMAQVYYQVPENRLISVSDNEAIDLGGEALKFIEAPMLHWPETMFTYFQEDEILFPCDFFGSHIANGLFDDEIGDLDVYAKKYYGEIMMPFRVMAAKALEKIHALPIQFIAPSHGPIYRNPNRIIELYNSWTKGETKLKATLVYVSMWGSTEKMIKQMAETLSEEGIEIAYYNLAVSDIGNLVKDLVDSRAVVIGAPTVLNGAHPLALNAVYLTKAVRPPIKYGVVLSSYGWAGGAVKQIYDMIGPMGLDVVGTLEINGPPYQKDLERIVEIGELLAKKIKGVS
jgi:flavorubredoxin